MGLINETQKINADVSKPKIKPLPSPTQGLEPDILGQQQQIIEQPEPPTLVSENETEAGGVSLPLQQPQPEPPVQPPPVEQVNSDVPEFSPIAPVSTPTTAAPTIAPTASIWNPVDEPGQFSVEVSNSRLPSFSIELPDVGASTGGASSLLQQAYSTSAKREEYAAAQQASILSNTRGALPNTPQADKRWHSSPIGWASDILFGSEQAKKQSEAGVPDASTGSFGRAGAGVGGAINYALGVIPSLVVGGAAETAKKTADVLENFGVNRKTAEGFAQNGFLQFLPEQFDAIKPSQILNLDFKEAERHNYLLDALAGDPLIDVNEPVGSSKYGRVYTRTQRKEGTSPTSDPVGFMLQLGTYALNPGEIPGDRVIGAAVGKIWNTIRPAKAAVESSKVVSNAPQLPSYEMRAEANLKNRAETARVQSAYRNQTKAPGIATDPSINFDYGDLAENTARRQANGTPVLNGVTGSPNILSPQKPLDYGVATLDTSEPVKLLPEAKYKVEYPTSPKSPYAANPQNVPRVYKGSDVIDVSQLPPVFESAPASTQKLLLPSSTPDKLALNLGMGNPNLFVTPQPEMVIRTLAEMKQKIVEVEPKLLEGAENIDTWEDLKLHLSDQVEDISQFNSVGESLNTVEPTNLVNKEEAYEVGTKIFNDMFGEENAGTEQQVGWRIMSVINTLNNPTKETITEELLSENIIDHTSIDMVYYGKATGTDVNRIVKGLAYELVDKSFEEIPDVLKKRYIDPYIRTTPQSLGELKTYVFNLFNMKWDGNKWSQQASIEKSKLSLTSDRIRKTRNIRKIVDDRSFAAIEKLDSANTEKTNVNASIDKLNNLIKESYEKTVVPLVESYNQNVDETLAILEDVKKTGNLEHKERLYEQIKSYTKWFELKLADLQKPINDATKLADKLTGNDLFVAEARYKIALSELKKVRIQNDLSLNNLKVTDDIIPTLDDLLTASEELARQKLAVEIPLQKLDELFADTVDFGRKQVDETSVRMYEPAALSSAVKTGSRSIVRLADKNLQSLFNEGDIDGIAAYARNTGQRLDELIDKAAIENNEYIVNASKVNRSITPDINLLTKPPLNIYHGTALDNWSPPNNLYANGSRGELGHGTYFSVNKKEAELYAKALVGDNVHPDTLNQDIKPGVYEVSHNFSSTLEANKPMPLTTVKEMLLEMPPELQKVLNASMKKRKSNLSLNQTKDLIESFFVKAKVEPTEELLTEVDAALSKSLREMGFDSVYDTKSGFLMSLDNSMVAVAKSELVKTPTVDEAVASRYNADALSSRHYPKRLTSDANLRDATYKQLSQTSANIDAQLAKTQQSILERSGEPTQRVLPDVDVPVNVPKTFDELVETLPTDDVCIL